MLSRARHVENTIILCFSLFGLLGILHHEMWRDELQAWMLARDSTSIINLIQNMQYEGHPALWHVCLYGLSQITHNPLIMQVFHLGISIGIVCLIAKFSPFSILHKFLLSSSYFIFFEYTLISRNYNMGIFFLFLFCVIYTHSYKNYLLLSITLALAANTNIYALIVSVILAIFLVYEGFQSGKFHLPLPLKLLASAFIFSFGGLVSALQILRVVILKLSTTSSIHNLPILNGQDLGTTSQVTKLDMVSAFFQDFKLVVDAINSIWHSYIPFPRMFDLHFWNRNILTFDPAIASPFGISGEELLACAFSLVLFGLAAYYFSQQRLIFWLYVFGNFILLSFIQLLLSVYDKPYARHYGYLFIFFIICLWLFNSSPVKFGSDVTAVQKSFRPKVAFYFITMILLIQATAGVYAVSMDYLFAFSNSKDTASFIAKKGFQEATIIGSQYRNVSVVSGYLDQPIYYPELQQFGTFWTRGFPEIEEEQLLNEVEAQTNSVEDQTILLVLTKPLSIKATDITITQVAQFNHSIVPDENFYLYTAQRLSR